jgi:hypothetical protein
VASWRSDLVPRRSVRLPKGAYGPLAFPTWLGGFSAFAGISLLCITLSRVNELAFARAIIPAVATGVAAAGFWLIAPAIAHHSLSQPYATRGVVARSAEEVLEHGFDYRRPNWRKPEFLATADYEIAARCKPGLSTRSPNNAAAFHVWSCVAIAGFHHHVLCHLPVQVMGYEIYRSQTIMGQPSKNCHHPGVTFIPPSLAEEWAQTSQPVAGGWRCHSSDALPHDPMATGDECAAGRQRLVISPLSYDKWTWRSYRTPIRRD